MKKIFAAVMTAVVIILSGCTAPYTEESIFAMDTLMSIKAYGGECDKAVKKACDKIYELDRLLSAEDVNSDVYRLNNSAGTNVSVSHETAEIIRESLYYSELTDGAADISVFPLVREWGFTAGSLSIPDGERINELLKSVGYSRIKADDTDVTLGEGQMIDLGSVAKGYAGDIVKDILAENGVSSALINLGGNIVASGRKPDGSEWNIAVTDPFSPDEYICAVRVSDKSVVTSGDYQRYFTAPDGTRYCHIIDTKTGYPASSGIASATITGESGIMCDALSTAVFVMGTEKAEKLWRDNDNFGMIIVTTDGELIITEDIENSITYFTDKKARVIHK